MHATALPSRLSSALAVETAATAVARRACQLLRGLLDADGAAITLETSAPYRVTLHASDQQADALEDLQDVLGEGPCMDAFESGQVVAAPLREEAQERWPFFAPAAAEIIGPDGLVWAIPMCSAGQVVGSVTLYRTRPGSPGLPVPDAQLVADAAAAALADDPSAYEAVTAPTGEDCWSSRAVIHQAAGMLAAHSVGSTEAALGWLRGYAFGSGRHLAEVARDVVGRTLPPAQLRSGPLAG